MQRATHRRAQGDYRFHHVKMPICRGDPQRTNPSRAQTIAAHPNAQLEAHNIEVSVTGGKVRLDGKVKAGSEQNLVKKGGLGSSRRCRR